MPNRFMQKPQKIRLIAFPFKALALRGGRARAANCIKYGTYTVHNNKVSMHLSTRLCAIILHATSRVEKYL
jgi:hypothetical protein